MKYPILKFYRLLFIILSIINFLAHIALSFSPEKYFIVDLSMLQPNHQKIGILIIGLGNSLFLYGLSEVIKILLDIEHNTSSSSNKTKKTSVAFWESSYLGIVIIILLLVIVFSISAIYNN